MKKQNTQRGLSSLMAAIATIFLLGAFNSTFAQNGEGARFGARDPHTCTDMKSPTKGAISAALATKYVVCSQEKAGHDYLNLIEDLNIQVGAAVPYNPKSPIYANDVDTKAPVYPLRASFKQYVCDALSQISDNRGRNCAIFDHPKATGVCYKTTFGDWGCSVTAVEVGGGKSVDNQPPPGGAKVAPNKNKPAATEVKPTVAKNNRQPAATKADDDNADFPKPDFTELEKYYEIVKYEYDILNRKLNLVVKPKTDTRPNSAAWRINFYDADGVAVIDENYVVGMSMFTPLGQAERAFAYLPLESQMKRVKKVVITRKVD